MSEATDSAGAPGLLRRFRPIQDRIAAFRTEATAGLLARGMPAEDANTVVGALGDGEILKWLILNADAIFAFIERIIKLFSEA